MTAYRPKTRSVTATVHTSAGWIRGTFTLPAIQGFLDFLNQSKGFHKLVNVTLPDGSEVPFLAVPRSAALALVPNQDDQNLQSRNLTGATAAHRILCLLDAGVIRGTLETANNLRVSDYLMQHSDFIALRDATIDFGSTPLGSDVAQPIPFIVILASGVVGVSESSPT
jgi:hypothetical protein